MVFAYRNPEIRTFNMRGMKFPLDMIFIRGGVIVEMRLNIPVPLPDRQPVSVQSREDADMVVEVNAGFVFDHNLKIGDEAVRGGI